MGLRQFIRCEVILLMMWLGLEVTTRAVAANIRPDHRPSHTNNRPGHGIGIQPIRTHLTTMVSGTEKNLPDVVPVIYDDSHCMNGGTGYLGAFCICPPYYTGRFCETDLLNDTTCGSLSHGDWIYQDCSICHCDDGFLVCELFELKGCSIRERSAYYNNGGSHRAPSMWWIITVVLLSTLYTYYENAFR